MSKELEAWFYIENKLKDLEYEAKRINAYLLANYIPSDKLELVKQALLKAQEMEKVLEIIKKKSNCLLFVECCKDYNDYKGKMDRNYSRYGKLEWDNKNWLDYVKLLTQEEFELLKQYFEKNIQK